jgi:NitT/TauT family transport system substrate-binding protein
MASRSYSVAAIAVAALFCAGTAGAQTTVTIGIGTQDTTTNTVTTGTIIRELKLFEKHLPKDGKDGRKFPNNPKRSGGCG